MLAQWLHGKMTDLVYGFGPASPDEPYIFGARRPGLPLHRVSQKTVDTWIAFMQAQGIARVVCLLPPEQLRYYDDLLVSYRVVFGTTHVCHAPIADFHLASEALLTDTILPFLADSHQQGAKTVVHCSGGIGRTGHVLAAWLVAFRGMSNQDAIAAVQQGGRNAREARDDGLDVLLDACRRRFADR